MSMIPPTTVSGFSTRPTFPYLIPPYTNGVPFTYRDGMTFLRRMEAFAKYIDEELIPWIDDGFKVYIDAFNNALKDITDYMNGQQAIIDNKVANFVNLSNEAQAKLEALVTQAQGYVTDAEDAQKAAEAAATLAEQWAANTQLLQDTAVAALANQLDSQTRTALNALYVSKADVFVWSRENLPAGSGPGGIRIDATAAANVPVNTNAKASEGYLAMGRGALGKATRARGCIAIGPDALGQGNPGFANLAIGIWALRNVQGVSEFAADMVGSRNIGIGSLAGTSITTGYRNTFIGRDSGQTITSGHNNTGVGYRALTAGRMPVALSGAIENQYPSAGSDNVAIGDTSGGMVLGNQNLMGGSYAGASAGVTNANVMLGYRAGFSLGTDLSENGKVIVYPAKASTYQVNGTVITVTANAHGAIAGNMVGVSFNTGELSAITQEVQWLPVATVVDVNTFTINVANIAVSAGSGNATLAQVETNSTGEVVGANTIIGSQANDSAKRSSGYNTYIGVESGKFSTGSQNTMIGGRSGYNQTSGDQNTYVGYNAGRANINGGALDGVSNTTVLGAGAGATGSNQVQLGNSDATPYAYSALQTRSDIRDKVDVKDSELGLDFIKALRPVQWRAKPRETGVEGARQHFGFIAQEVGELVKRSGVDFSGWQDHSVAGGDDVQTLGMTEFIGPIVSALQAISDRLDKAGL